ATTSFVVRTDTAPVARLTLSQLATPALTVKADGSTSTDTDYAPIASYQFTFGDGTAAVTTTAPTATAQHTYAAAGTYTVTVTATAPPATAQHTYAAAGTYTVTLVATDSGGNASAAATTSVTVTATDSPPVARLAVTANGLTASADGSGSTDTDATPIASYRF